MVDLRVDDPEHERRMAYANALMRQGMSGGPAYGGVAEAVMRGRARAKAAESRLWRRLEEDLPDLDLAMPSAKLAARKMLAEMGPHAATPEGETASILGAAAGLPDVLRYRDIQQLRSRVVNARDRMVRAGNAVDGRRLSPVLGGLDDDLAQAARAGDEGGSAPPMASRAASASDLPASPFSDMRSYYEQYVKGRAKNDLVPDDLYLSDRSLKHIKEQRPGMVDLLGDRLENVHDLPGRIPPNPTAPDPWARPWLVVSTGKDNAFITEVRPRRRGVDLVNASGPVKPSRLVKAEQRAREMGIDPEGLTVARLEGRMGPSSSSAPEGASRSLRISDGQPGSSEISPTAPDLQPKFGHEEAAAYRAARAVLRRRKGGRLEHDAEPVRRLRLGADRQGPGPCRLCYGFLTTAAGVMGLQPSRSGGTEADRRGHARPRSRTRPGA